MSRLAVLAPLLAVAACATPAAPTRAVDLPVLAAAAAERAEDAPQSPTGTRPAEDLGAYPEHSGILTAQLGYRRMHDSLWEPVDDAFAAGLEYCFRPPTSFVGLAAGVLGSYTSKDQAFAGTSTDLEAWTAEGYLGPKVFVEPASVPLQLWAGLGASFLYADVEGVVGGSALRDNDVTFGGYGQVGAAFRLNRRQSVGLEYRTVFATDVDLFGTSGNADYSQIALTFSVGF